MGAIALNLTSSSSYIVLSALLLVFHSLTILLLPTPMKYTRYRIEIDWLTILTASKSM